MLIARLSRRPRSRPRILTALIGSIAVASWLVGTPPIGAIAAERTPVAHLSVSRSADSPLTVTADAAGSKDTDRTPIARYHFRFGDGTSVIRKRPGKTTARHTYAADGTYIVTLRATDTAGNHSERVAVRVTVTTPPPERAPIAKLTLSKSPTSPLSISADASGSTDVDSTPISHYRFDFDDGTSPVTTSAPTAVARHTYAGSGTFAVTVTVTDTIGTVSVPATATITVTQGPPVAVYVGYYDTHHSHDEQPKPNPWKGDTGVLFDGRADTDTGRWDTSTVRVDNLTRSSLSGVAVTVDIGSDHYSLWGSTTLPAGGHLIVAQTGTENFDGSDTNRAGCYGCNPDLCDSAVSDTIPVVRVTVAGQTTTYMDSDQVLNTRGADAAGCPDTGSRNDESTDWRRLSPAS